MQEITVVKVGGGVLEQPESFISFIHTFASLKGKKLLVHGGGRTATTIASRLGIESRLVDGRRVTDADTLQVVTMVYGGLVNKQVVAALQAMDINAIGLTGADMNAILARRRTGGSVDYGYVGDIIHTDGNVLHLLLETALVPVIAPLTHDGQGQLLNTNADTIAAAVAASLVPFYRVRLVYCFEKPGVLIDPDKDNSVISHITRHSYASLLKNGTIHGGMIPKLDNAFSALQKGVSQVIITNAGSLTSYDKGTLLTID